MRIWLQSSAYLPTPAPSTGGLEYIVASLGAELARRGHEVTLFALDGSHVPGVELVSMFRYRTPSETETAVVDRMERRPRPDVLFDHSRWQMAQRRWPNLAAVTMIHGNAALEGHARNRVFCSVAHGRWHGAKEPVALLNGIEPSEFTVGGPMAGRGPALWLGRIMAYKRPHLAIDLCQRAGVPITVAGPAADADYFSNEVRPRLQPEGWGRYVGELAGAERLRLLSEACCLVFTSEAQEPAGIVMHEAMASGTPVFAFDHGANREFINGMVTGYLAASEEEFEEWLRLRAWLSIDPAACRRHVEENLSIAAMTTKAEGLLAQAADGVTW
ncbi:MAG: hypothetical protein A2V88_08945 [Elusimicrobia bacterium RBG_16_66_12]|nr:MAG: hypothetical protein A2V88_08945 [Elusimicrobia bacterium RBG_16_66_12]